jgi:hypothetical protein
METKCLSQCWQQPVTCLYPEPDEFISLPVYFNTTLSALLRSRKRCIPLRFPYCNLHAFLFSRFRNTYHAHIFYHYLLTLIMFGDAYKSRCLSFRNYLQPHLTSSTSFPLVQCLRGSSASFFNVRDHTNIILNGMKTMKYNRTKS